MTTWNIGGLKVSVARVKGEGGKEDAISIGFVPPRDAPAGERIEAWFPGRSRKELLLAVRKALYG